MDTIKLRAPEGGTGLSFEGTNYDVDENGLVEVPGHADLGNLRAMGFLPYSPPAPATPETGGTGDDQGEAGTSAAPGAPTAPIVPPWLNP